MMKIKRLPGQGSFEHVRLFAEAIARDWPNTVEEAKCWVKEEWNHPSTQVFLAEENEIAVGCVFALDFDFVFSHHNEEEQQKLFSATEEKNFSAMENLSFVGGLGVKAGYTAKGVATLLLRSVQAWAKQENKFLLGHTGRPSKKYSSLKALPLVLSLGFEEIFPKGSFYYPNPPDLEKVWVAFKP
ncbi:MAG: GNAT family N-acetyltransferase [Patescibacteria group bacterium]|nr:GNAT family N-acetyltransferase [Patescibacteria group bacterium]